MRVVLASESPRRAELLRAAGFEIDIVPGRIDEQRLPGEAPQEYVLRVAMNKAAAAGARADGLPIIAADTVVIVDEDVLGKPVHDADAARMIRMLSGRAHEVLTGVAVLTRRGRRGQVERTCVRMSPLTDAEIEWYVSTGEPRDKAGAYAVQGLASRFIERIEGSYTNVVGLPVSTVYRLLGELGESPLSVDPARHRR